MPIACYFNCEDRGYEIDKVVRVEPAIGINGDRYHPFGWRSRSFVQQRGKQKAAALLEQMTLDEKVGQLIAGHIPTCGGYLYRRPLDALLGEHA